MIFPPSDVEAPSRGSRPCCLYKGNVMRKIASSLLFTLAVVGLYVVQIDLASSFGFRRFTGGTGATTNNPPPAPAPNPSPTPTFNRGQANDPGVRGGAAGAGAPLPGLTAGQLAFFTQGQEVFNTAEEVDEGLGPRMNLDSCGGCHAQPAIGGTSPFTNPQVAFANLDGGSDEVPFFVTMNGPIREARSKFNPDGSSDGGAQNTASLTGRA